MAMRIRWLGFGWWPFRDGGAMVRGASWFAIGQPLPESGRGTVNEDGGKIPALRAAAVPWSSRFIDRHSR